MDDIGEIAKILTAYVVNSEYLNMHVPSIEDRMYDIVNWLMPDISIGSAKSFAQRMKEARSAKVIRNE